MEPFRAATPHRRPLIGQSTLALAIYDLPLALLQHSSEAPRCSPLLTDGAASARISNARSDLGAPYTEYYVSITHATRVLFVLVEFETAVDTVLGVRAVLPFIFSSSLCVSSRISCLSHPALHLRPHPVLPRPAPKSLPPTITSLTIPELTRIIGLFD
ncbi:hypothetical protein TMatcc_006592 [Talaromyces marneffei ATCC 18224]